MPDIAALTNLDVPIFLLSNVPEIVTSSKEPLTVLSWLASIVIVALVLALYVLFDVVAVIVNLVILAVDTEFKV